MSFEKMHGTELPEKAQPVWQQYRDQFPITKHSVYLNHAAVSPLSVRCADAMKQLADDVMQHGSLHYDQWMAAYDAIRIGAARLIGAKPSEIALVKNTSEGIATIAMGLSWRTGDKIVCFREEFPANFLPWQRLESKGVTIETLSIEDPLERIEQACRGARLLAISYVNYLSGIRVNLEAIGDICRRQGCFYFVDAIQGMGAFAIDVEAARIDALAADGHKWMIGPEGCGVLFVRQSRQQEIEPVEFGWTNVANYGSYSLTNHQLRSDAGRYECGTLNTIGSYGLRAAIELLLEVGVDRISEQVQALGDRVAAGVQSKGYEVLAKRTPENGAGIVSFRKAGMDSRIIVKKLKDAGIQAVPRQGWVRTAPHFYISPGDIDQVVAQLD